MRGKTHALDLIDLLIHMEALLHDADIFKQPGLTPSIQPVAA